MEVKIANTEDVKDLFELNTLFGNVTTVELMEKCLFENNYEISCIAYEGIAAGFCSGHIVNSICYGEKRAEIEAWYVKENYRRQGIGKALLSCLEKAFAELGIYHYHINTLHDYTNFNKRCKKFSQKSTVKVLFDFL